MSKGTLSPRRYASFLNSSPGISVMSEPNGSSTPIRSPEMPLSAMTAVFGFRGTSLEIPGPTREKSPPAARCAATDRKSTRLNSSHGYISHALLSFKKKTTKMLDDDVLDPL